MLKRLIFVVLLAIVLSCHSQDNTKVINVDYERNYPEINASTLFSTNINFKYLPNTATIADIGKIVRYGKYSIILDKLEGRNKVIILDNNSSEFKELSNLGRGPGEWTDIIDISFNSSSEILLLYCQGLKKVLGYNIEGSFKFEFHTKPVFFKIASKGNCIFLYKDLLTFNNKKEYYIYSYNFNGELLSKHIEIINPTKKPVYFGAHNSFAEFKDEIHITIPSHRVVYKINCTGKIEPEWMFNFGNSHNLPNSNQIISFEMLTRLADNGYGLFFENYIETSAFINFKYFGTGWNRYARNILYDKSRDEITYYSKIRNDLNGLRLINNIVGSTKNGLIFAIGSYDLIEYDKFGSGVPKLSERIIEDCIENDCIILMTLTFKNIR